MDEQSLSISTIDSDLFNDLIKDIKPPQINHKQSLLNKIIIPLPNKIPDNISLKDYFWKNDWFTSAGHDLFSHFKNIMAEYINNNLITLCPELQNNNLSISQIQQYIYNPLIELKNEFKNKLIPYINKFIGDINTDYEFIYMRCLNRYFDRDKHLLQWAIKDALNNINIDESQITSLRLLIKKITALITEYLNNNLDDLLPKLSFPQKDNGTYTFSWQNNMGGYNFKDDCSTVLKYLEQHISDVLYNIDLTNMQNISEDWKYILEQYEIPKDIGLKVRNYIIHLNDNIVNKRAEALETNNDKVHDTTIIDYDPENDHEREKPIIIYRVIIDNRYKDLVIIGKRGASHGDTLNDEFIQEMKKLNLSTELNDKNEYTQAYLLGRIAFVNRKMYSTYSSWDEVQDILVNDSRIDKVYSVPESRNGGTIVRLAKLYF